METKINDRFFLIYQIESSDWIVQEIGEDEEYWCESLEEANQLAYELANDIEDGMMADEEN